MSEQVNILIALIDRCKAEGKYEVAAKNVKIALKNPNVGDADVALLFEKLVEMQNIEFRVYLDDVVDEFCISGDFVPATGLLLALSKHLKDKETDIESSFSVFRVLAAKDRVDKLEGKADLDVEGFEVDADLANARSMLDGAIESVMNTEVNIQKPRINEMIAARLVDTGKYDSALKFIESGLKEARKSKDQVFIQKLSALSQRAKKLKKADKKAELRLINDQKESKKKKAEKQEKAEKKQKQQKEKGKEKQKVNETKENEKAGGGEETEQGLSEEPKGSQAAFKRQEETIPFQIVREELCGEDCYVGFIKSNVSPVKKAFIKAQDPHVNRLQKLVDVCSKHKCLLGVEQAVKVGKEDVIYLVTEVAYPIISYFHLVCQKECPESPKKWWEVIEEKFWIIFRDIIHGLIYLFKTGHACGNVSFNTFVTPDGRGRLLPSLGSPKPKDDIKELSQLMKTMIGFPFGGNDMSFIPRDLMSFLDIIDNSTLPKSKSILVLPEFLVDHPYFWTIQEKIDFCFKLRKLIKTDTVYEVIEQVLEKYKSFESWKTAIPTGVYHEVLDKPNKSGNLKKYRTRVDIVRFFYAVYTHINEKEYKQKRGKEKLTDVQIEEALMGYYPDFYLDMFKCLCECGGKGISEESLRKLSSVDSQAERPIKARRN